MSTLYLAWREPGRRWWPVGQLTHARDRYEFRYTKGARLPDVEAAGFRPIFGFPDFNEIYVSEELFPLFANRLPPRSRPDYEDFVQWLNLGAGESDPMILLARSGGRRETDMFEVFPVPERAAGRYEASFFIHGIRHRGTEAEDAACELRPGDPLVLREEPENPKDPSALKVLLAVGGTVLGYLPRYLCKDVHFLRRFDEEHVKASVKQINLSPAPSQFRVLCRLDALWPENFKPFSDSAFESVRDRPEYIA